MNKKGFTLVELLSSITIMGIIATIASINIIKIFDNKNNEAEIAKENIITKAACIYIELDKNKSLKETCLSYGCTLTTNELIKEGLLYEEDVDKEQVINIYKENNEKKCIIK